jgi:hypothetical protein
MFSHHNIHKYTWTSPDGKTHIQLDHILIDKRLHSSTVDDGYFRGANCDTIIWWLQKLGRMSVSK